MTNRYPSRINWENEPSIQTPINETNLNRMDNALFNMAADVVSLDNETFKSVSYDSSNGKFTFVKGNGQTYVLDTALEKIATNFRYDSTTQSLILTLADGTTQSIDLSDMITNVDLEDSTTISWTITSGKAKANIINGSITSDKLQPNYLSDITNQANKATTASTNAAKDKLVAEGYANGKQNGVPVDSTSPYYHNNAEYFKDQAQAVSHVEIATTTTPGIVKPDGTTITVEADGTIHGANTYTLPTASASTLGGIKVGTNLTIDADGTLNASGGSSYTLPTASTTTLGGVKVDGKTIKINDGVISVDKNEVIPPDGATTLPIDNVQRWIACGGRSDDFNYTSMSQVLADNTCLLALMSDENAMKYLARSTGFISDICGNESAMTYLGQSAYADDTVLKSEAWCVGIINSTYFEKVYTVQIPNMTSATSPYGTVTSSGFGNTSFADYMAFSKSGVGLVYSVGYLQYQAVQDMDIRALYLKFRPSTNYAIGIDVEISNDGSTWEKIHYQYLPVSSETQLIYKVNITNKKARYIKFTHDSSSFQYIYTVPYGRS